ncbi:MAG: hypothetical protein Q9172_006661 [Xanthocarpia lactea]
MRLINTTTLELREFIGLDVPVYAILSHRWGPDEATFQDFERGVQQTREGFTKIEKSCNEALKSDIGWAWADTCCIDKESSAELTEAINSMYEWYRRAWVCYVYLADVLWEQSTSDSSQPSLKRFRRSAWFTRGWTLQELIAPQDVRFFDCGWQFLGTKDGLADEISEITGIDRHHLLPNTYIKEAGPCISALNCLGHPSQESHWPSHKPLPSIATRMSWMSMRQTTRVEDMAYCLLGIFDVNMPLLYGEGPKAFMRLQLEIIKQSNDDSIFAWVSNQFSGGLLAPWPSSFVASRFVQKRAPIETRRRPYAMTNQGLHFPITWRAGELRSESEVRELRVLLDCGICGPQGFKNIMLRLEPRSGNSWYRICTPVLEQMDMGPWRHPLLRSPSLLTQDPVTLNKFTAMLAYKKRQPWAQADPLNDLKEITVEAGNVQSSYFVFTEQ